MYRLVKNILMICVLLVFTQNISANEQTDLKNHFLSKIDMVLAIVEDSTLSKCKRNDDIINVLEPTFDFELMAKLSLGQTWKSLSDKDQDRFVELYVKRMRESYSSKIDSYSGEKINILKVEQPKETRITLVTDLASEKNRLEVVYKFHKPRDKKENKDEWLIYDVEISGVSILKTDIAQFKEFLKTKDIQDLMDVLSKS